MERLERDVYQGCSRTKLDDLRLLYRNRDFVTLVG